MLRQTSREVMLRTAVFAALAAGVLVTSIAALPNAAFWRQEASAEAIEGQAVSAERAWSAEWNGFVRAGPADMLAHTRETEGAVAPLARMGFNVEVPEGTTALEFALSWAPGTKMHLMAHGPRGAGMPTYMGEWPESGEDCIRVPSVEVVAGTWKVMAHSERSAVDVDFVITVRTVGGAAPTLLEELHGHPAGDAMNMPMRGVKPCEG